MKKKTRKMLVALMAVMIAVVIGMVVCKAKK